MTEVLEPVVAYDRTAAETADELFLQFAGLQMSQTESIDDTTYVGKHRSGATTYEEDLKAQPAKRLYAIQRQLYRAMFDERTLGDDAEARAIGADVRTITEVLVRKQSKLSGLHRIGATEIRRDTDSNLNYILDEHVVQPSDYRGAMMRTAKLAREHRRDNKSRSEERQTRIAERYLSRLALNHLTAEEYAIEATQLTAYITDASPYIVARSKVAFKHAARWFGQTVRRNSHQ
jgi:hypothetical protein